MRLRLHNQSGMTVIEVLIAAVVFMVGFSTLILLMNSSLVKFSASELLHANNLAHESMTVSIATGDTTSIDTVITRSGIAYRLTQEVNITDDLVGLSITVYRHKQERKILELYDAFVSR
jgi:Tfp pilus assembly protein PilV